MNIFHKMRTLFILQFSNRVFTLFYRPVSFSCTFIFRCSRLITLTYCNHSCFYLSKCLSAEKVHKQSMSKVIIQPRDILMPSEHIYLCVCSKVNLLKAVMRTFFQMHFLPKSLQCTISQELL